MEKKRYYELDFVRAVCAAIVVCYHFSCALDIFEIQGFENILYLFPNGKWGEMAVSVFFMLSGAVMFYNYGGKKLNAPAFYKKRWLSLFPMFYVMWILMYVIKSGVSGNWFWGGEPKLLLLSLFGMDGYFYYRQPNYHSIGEWFLGAIIFLYLLYPLLKKLFERFKWPTTVLLTATWTMIFVVDWFEVGTFYNLLTCIWSFWIGMLLMEYREYWKKLGVAFAAAWLVLLIWKLPVNDTIGMNLTAITAFITLFGVGGWVMRSKLIREIVLTISRNSYGIFLTHHVIIDSWVKTERYGQIGLKKNLLWMAAALIAAYISAVLLRIFAEALQREIRLNINRLTEKRLSK